MIKLFVTYIKDVIINLYFLVASSRGEIPDGQQELQTLPSIFRYVLPVF
jgi:hypothetical protein